VPSKGGRARATLDDVKEAPMRVTLTGPEIAGSYIVAAPRDDGTRVLRPENSDRSGTEEPARALAERHRETLDNLAEHY
jgi:hypothetical protein